MKRCCVAVPQSFINKALAFSWHISAVSRRARVWIIVESSDIADIKDFMNYIIALDSPRSVRLDLAHIHRDVYTGEVPETL